MASTFIIVFRETLEAALIVAIVLAASKGIAGRAWWVSAGIVAGLSGAGLLALFASRLADLFDGMGTEVFNAAVLLDRGRHARLAPDLDGRAWRRARRREPCGRPRRARRAARPLSALAIICAVAVLREGSETVLFLYRHRRRRRARHTLTMLEGGAARRRQRQALVGALFYGGLLRVPLKHIFRVTGVILMLLAAGLAAQAAAFLVQAGLLPPLGYDIWNTSGVLPQTNAGRLPAAHTGRLCRAAGRHPDRSPMPRRWRIILAASALVRRRHPARAVSRAEPKTLHQPAGREIRIAGREDCAVRLVAGIVPATIGVSSDSARRAIASAGIQPVDRPRRQPAKDVGEKRIVRAGEHDDVGAPAVLLDEAGRDLGQHRAIGERFAADIGLGHARQVLAADQADMALRGK